MDKVNNLSNMPHQNFRLDHIAYAVKSTDVAIRYFKQILPVIEIYKAIEPSQDVYYTYITDKNNTQRIELVESFGKTSPVYAMTKETQSQIYHTGYRTNDFHTTLVALRNNKYVQVSKKFTPVNESDIFVCHLYNPYVGLIEIMGPKIPAVV